MDAEEKVNILMVDDQPAKLISYEAILGQLNERLGSRLLQAGKRSNACSRTILPSF